VNSSTSSFDPAFESESSALRAPAFGFRLMLLTLAISLFALLCWEFWLRSRGVQVDGTPQLSAWAARFEQAKRSGPDAIVFIGSSRVKCGIVPAEVASGAGIERDQVHNLAVVNSSSLPVLEALADSEFRGTVVCEVLPSHFYGDAGRAEAREALNAADGWRGAQAMEGSVEGHARRNMRLLNPRATPLMLAQRIQLDLRGKVRPDAFGGADDIARIHHEDGWEEIISSSRTPRQWLETAEVHAGNVRKASRPATVEGLKELSVTLSELVARINARGGRVVFVRMPVSGVVEDVEFELYPPKLCWTRALGGVDAEEVHYLSDGPVLEPVDGSHLDSKAAREYSRWIGRYLQESDRR